MTLKSDWNIISDDENSRQSFLSDCDSEFDLSSLPRYPAQKCSISALSKLSLNRHEPPMTRLRTKTSGQTMVIPQLSPKEQYQSIVRHSVDSIVYSKQELSDNRLPNSPTDGVNKLVDWFESCSLDEMNRKCFWSSQKTNNHYVHPITPSSIQIKSNSNPFATSLSIQSSDQQQTQLWSHFRFAASTIRDNLSFQQLNSIPSDTFNSFNTSHFLKQSPLFSSSPSQIVPSVFTTTSSPFVEDLSSAFLKQPSTKKQSLLNIFSILIIFIVGLMLGYLLTNTFPPNLLRQWIFIIWKLCIEISVKYYHLISAHLAIVMKSFSSFILV